MTTQGSETVERCALPPGELARVSYPARALHAVHDGAAAVPAACWRAGVLVSTGAPEDVMRAAPHKAARARSVLADHGHHNGCSFLCHAQSPIKRGAAH